MQIRRRQYNARAHRRPRREFLVAGWVDRRWVMGTMIAATSSQNAKKRKRRQFGFRTCTELISWVKPECTPFAESTWRSEQVVAARKISTGELSSRVPDRLASRRDELGELVRDFKQMADQIEQLMETQHQLLRDISHELRSPLARLNVALELARTSTGNDAVLALECIEQESERLNEMMGRLLTLARIKTLVDPPHHSAVELRPIIDQIAEDAAFEASRGSVVWQSRVQLIAPYRDPMSYCIAQSRTWFEMPFDMHPRACPFISN
jgi:signal transduction histidine kinase